MPALRIHWCSPLDNGQQKATKQHNTNALDFTSIVDFAQEADELGIDSLLMSISYHMPDPLRMIGTMHGGQLSGSRRILAGVQKSRHQRVHLLWLADP
ncbi:MAG: hypothetical protein WCA48_32165 [Pseudomonas gingeri]